mmetsp:Transcript_26712/g.60329  ORF Transcript_26712/g.60329 Transcript_26712/m.60329 type:complete len:405 (-) Transcript_26712:82-1296(-)
MVPEGLTCKNTFFDLAEDSPGLDLPAGPATCPPSSEGWWWLSSSLGSDTSTGRGGSMPSSPQTPLDVPGLGDKAQIISTPSWFGDTPPVTQTAFLNTPSWLDDLAPYPSSHVPLSTPDWMEGDVPAFANPCSLQPPRSIPKRSQTPGSEAPPSATEGSGAMHRTPDPFDDTPSPPMDHHFGSPSNRFVQLLAGAVADEEAASAHLPARVEPPSPGGPINPNTGNPGNWARPLIKPPMLLATAAPHNETPASYGFAPAIGLPPVPMPPLQNAGARAVGAELQRNFGLPAGLGAGPWAHFDDASAEPGRSMRETSDSPVKAKKLSMKVASTHETKFPLPAGLLLPGQVAPHGGRQVLPFGDGEEASPSRRRKRGSRESKEPDMSEDDPSGFMPTAAFIDLGVLQRA